MRLPARHLREVLVAAAFGALVLLLAVRAPQFFERDTLRAFLVMNAPLLAASVGMTFVILCRQIDISIAAQVSVCGVLAGLMARSGLPMPLVVPATILVGAAMGAVNGAFVAWGGLPSIVVTLATLMIGRESLRYLGQGVAVGGLPPGFQWFGLGQDVGSWAMVAAALVVLAVAGWGLHSLAAGRALYAVGSSPEAARLAGVRPRLVVFGAFVAMGALSGLAALLNAARFGQVEADSGKGLEMQVIAAVVVGGAAVSGGRGTMVGTLLGVALLGTVGQALYYLKVPVEWERAAQGALILLAVAGDAPGLRGRRGPSA